MEEGGEEVERHDEGVVVNARRIGASAVPVPLVILALLAVADGVTTHIGLAFGATEVNPLLAALFAVHPLVGEGFRVGVWVAVIAVFWRAHRSPSCSRHWLHRIQVAAIGIIGTVVALNAGQLALLWWLLT